MESPSEELIDAHERISGLVRIAQVCEQSEGYEFPGIKYESHADLKDAEVNHPAPVTGIDDLILRMETQGAKVVLGKYPDSGNVFILPNGSDDIVSDSIFPRQLDVAGVSDNNYRDLILLDAQR